MIFDLFSSADYCYTNLQFLNFMIWLIGFSWMFWKVKSFFFVLHRLKSFFSFLVSWHYDNVFSGVLKIMKGSYMMISGSFFLMLGSNMFGLFPYVFGVTTQMVLTFTASWMMWLSMIYSSGEFSILGFFSHFVPLGSPMYLAPILSIMELVSSIMRPLTLSLRLSMKMTTGHVFMALMAVSSNLVLFLMKILLVVLLFLMWGYLIFEVGMSMVQGLVFSLLSVKYLSEHV